MMTYEAVEKMNQLYKESKFWAKACLFVFVTGVLGILLWGLLAPQSSIIFFLLIYIFGGGYYCLAVLQPKCAAADREMRDMYKDTFLNSMLNEFFDNAHYMGQFGFTQQKVEEFDLYEFGNRFHSEDHLTGDYKGVHFEQADVYIWRESHSDHGNDVDYFKGRMFIFDIPIRNIQSIKIFNKLPMDNKMDYRIRGKEENRVQMESVEFNDAFSVYSEDAHDAFYVLTPAMMETLMNVYRRYCKIGGYGAHDISFHFKDGKLYFAMGCFGNAFDPGAFPINYPQEKAKMKEDIQVIIDVIESLELIDKDALDGKVENEETERMDNVIVTEEKEVKSSFSFQLNM